MADLAGFLRALQSGHNTLSPEMYAHFGGDDILSKIQKFDPGAKWSDSAMGGGEGGEGPMGKRLDFDITKMPKPKNTDLLNARAVADNDENLINKNYKWDDENYGSISTSKNIDHHVDNIEKYGPAIAAMMIGMGGPMLGAALMGAGIGGGAGFTSAVTGGAAGLGSGAIPGAMGAGTFTAANAPGWLQQLAKPSSVRSIGNQIHGGRFNPMSAAGTAAGASGMSLSQLAGLFR